MNINFIFSQLVALLWQDQNKRELSSVSRLMLNLLKIFCIIIIEYRKNLIPLRTNSLTYTVTLSLVPVLALGTSIMKGMGAGGELRKAAYQFVEQITVIPSDEKKYEIKGQHSEKGKNTLYKEESIDKVDTSSEQTAGQHLKETIDKIFNYVDNTNFATLGIVGIIGVLITVISLLRYIEEAMNTIWNTSKSRPLSRKLTDYLSIVILLPLAINVGFWAMAALQSKAYITVPANFHDMMPLITFMLKLLPAMFIIGIFTMLYSFLPNTEVKIYPALIGAMFGGICWLALQAFYIKLQIGVANYNAIYGSFASMPLFLLWVYSGWFVFLLGAEISFAAQNYKHYTPPFTGQTPSRKIAAGFNIMIMLCDAFKQGRVLSSADLARGSGVRDFETFAIIESFIQAGLIHRVSEKNNAEEKFAPSLPCTKISNPLIFKVLFGHKDQKAYITEGDRLSALAAKAAINSLKKSDETTKKGNIYT